MANPLGRDAYQEFGVEGFSGKMEGARKSAYALRKACAIVPNVDSQGRSHDRDAEQLYAQKEEEEKKAQRLLNTLLDVRAAIAKRLPAALARAGAAEAAEQRIHGAEAKAEIGSAAREAQTAYAELVFHEQQVVLAIEELTAAINLSHTKKWPLGEPKKNPPAWGGGGGSGPSTNPAGPSPFEYELESLGPGGGPEQLPRNTHGGPRDFPVPPIGWL